MATLPKPSLGREARREADDGRIEPARVCCIVLNWNGWADTLVCLQALDLQVVRDPDELAVVVVDNGSTNDSVARLTEALAARAPGGIRMELVESGRNGGFSFGNNVGLVRGRAYRPEFFWLLNNDTAAPPDSLRKLLREAIRAPGIGLVGTVLYRFDQPETVQMWGGGEVVASRARIRCFEQPRPPADNQFLTFASVLLRAEMVRQIGGLDERFFMYYEDVEFCLRARRAGWLQTVASDTAVRHKEGGSDGNHLRLERTTTTSALQLLEACERYPLWGQLVYFSRRVAKRALLGRWANVAAVLAGGREFLRRRKLDPGLANDTGHADGSRKRTLDRQAA